MIRLQRTATVKSYWDFGDVIVITVYFYLNNSCIEHQFELNEHDINEYFDGCVYEQIIGKTIEVDIQIFEKDNGGEIMIVSLD